MLRSFEYTEQSYSNVELQDDLLWDKEVYIAKKFCEIHESNRNNIRICPLCNKNAGKYFFTKWKVDYLYCKECGSVYVSCDKEIVEEYRKQKDLLDLRKSDVFQNEIAKRRVEQWFEFLEWMQIRAFRFLKRNKKLSILDVGNRYYDYVKLIQQSELCGKYQLADSILEGAGELGTVAVEYKNWADVVFYFDEMRQETAPKDKLQTISKCLKDDGLLVLGTRAGSGFDILTLKEHNEKIYPYEHVLLPSVKGLITLLRENGYKILEVTTPGIMDIQYVKQGMKWLDDSNLFVKNLMNAEESILQEFQRFLQKSGMSSFVRVIATKER